MTTEARKQMDLAISERQFQDQVVRFARLHQWRVYHTYDSRRSAAGFPDLLLCRLHPTTRGTTTELVFFEVKAERGRLTDAQSEWLFLLNAVPGVLARVVRPSDWPSIVEILATPPRGGSG